MIRNGLVLGLILVFLTGCASVGQFTTNTETNVQLSENNYRVVAANAIGRSYGFKLLRFIDIISPTYTRALSRLHKKAGLVEGKAQALANIVKEESSLDLIVFSIPRVTVRADVVEFTR